MKGLYLPALDRIPRGETRTFLELAAMAGRPGAARAAGRALSQCPLSSAIPWHRVVATDGSLARDAERRRVQQERLQSEDARPRDGESIPNWAKRCGLTVIGHYAIRRFADPEDPRVQGWSPPLVEGFRESALAIARGFVAIDGEQDSHADAASTLPAPRKSSLPASLPTLSTRIETLPWNRIRQELNGNGYCHLPGLLHPGECAEILNASTSLQRFERTIPMGTKGYGIGTYHYYRDPLPEPAETLRSHLYLQLKPDGFPATLSELHERCKAEGQRRSSCILLCYPTGGVNHPHRDLYGKVWFPYQAVVVLSARGEEFEGGEFLLLEEKGAGEEEHRVVATLGDVVMFASRERFETSGRHRRVALRHGMSPITRGVRYALGIVFNLAE